MLIESPEVKRSILMTAEERRASGALALLFMFRMLGLFMLMPVLSVLGQKLDGSTGLLIGVAIGAYGLTQAIFQVPFGILSDRLGRKPIIMVGLVLFALGGVLAAVADSIYGVIAGRLLQGTGAIASPVLALLSDFTREETRTKAMAMVGFSIGVSFSVALVLGPVLGQWLGLSGLFWATVVLACLGMLVCVFVVPKPLAPAHNRDVQLDSKALTSVIKDTSLLRLDLGVFVLHMVLTACFVVLPISLVETGGIDVSRHGMVYLPVMLTAFLLMLPLMILAEVKRQIKPVFLLAILVASGSFMGMAFLHTRFEGLVAALFLFFWSFNLLEAMLPSLVSKLAPAGSRGGAMGIYSSAQFLGAFVGGVLGGWLYERFGAQSVFVFASVVLLVWFTCALSMKKPRFVQSVRLGVDGLTAENAQWVAENLREVKGVEDVYVALGEGLVYMKVDKKHLDQDAVNRFSLPG